MAVNKYIFYKKLQVTYASVKDVQSKEEGFSTQKRPFSTSKHGISFVGHFALWDPDSDSES